MVFKVYSNVMMEGEMQAIIAVLVFPPSESLSRRVSLESL